MGNWREVSLDCRQCSVCPSGCERHTATPGHLRLDSKHRCSITENLRTEPDSKLRLGSKFNLTHRKTKNRYIVVQLTTALKTCGIIFLTIMINRSQWDGFLYTVSTQRKLHWSLDRNFTVMGVQWESSKGQ